MASTINSDNGVVSGSSGLKSTADTSGVLALQSNGSTGVTLDTSLNVGIGTSSPQEKLHVNSGTGNVPLLLESTDPVVLATFKDNNTTGTIGIGAQSNDMFIYAGNAERLRIDSAGNLGLGVTPSAWNTLKAIEQQNGTFWASYSGDADSYFGANAYYSSGWIRKIAGYASYYRQTTGQHQWAVAASSTAGSAISFTQAMTLNASGALGFGSGPSYGTSGQVLTSGGSGAAPTWATPSAGAMVYISTTTATNATNVDITGLDSTYDNYVILCPNLSTTTGIQLGGLFLVGGSPVTGSYGSSGYDTSWSNTDLVKLVNNTSMFFIYGNFADGRQASLKLEISKNSVSFGNSVHSSVMFNSGSGFPNGADMICGRNGSNNINGIRIYDSYGGAANCLSGTFRLYGIVKS